VPVFSWNTPYEVAAATGSQYCPAVLENFRSDRDLVAYSQEWAGEVLVGLRDPFLAAATPADEGLLAHGVDGGFAGLSVKVCTSG
jgi:hypothetical protein